MGELGKIVPHSPMRFSKLRYDAAGSIVSVSGVKGETVVVTWAVDAGAKTTEVACTFAETGTMVATAATDFETAGPGLRNETTPLLNASICNRIEVTKTRSGQSAMGH